MPLPVRKLLLEQPSAEPLPLPDRKVRVLDRQRRQGRRPPRAVSRVERRELPVEDVSGPSVEGDVVNVDEQDILLAAQTQQRRPQQRSPRQIEGRLRFLLDDTPDLRFSRVLRQGAEIDDRQQPRSKRLNDLNRAAVHQLDDTAQDLVTTLNRIQSLPKCLDVQRPPDAVSLRDVVNGHSRIEPVQ